MQDEHVGKPGFYIVDQDTGVRVPVDAAGQAEAKAITEQAAADSMTAQAADAAIKDLAKRAADVGKKSPAEPAATEQAAAEKAAPTPILTKPAKG